MENEDIKFNEFSENEIEGSKNFLKVQLDEMVLPYIYENKLMLFDRNNDVYQEYIKISADSEKLSKIYADETLNPQEKNNQLNELLKELYTRTKKLIISVSTSDNKIDFEVNNQYKVK